MPRLGGWAEHIQFVSMTQHIHVCLNHVSCLHHVPDVAHIIKHINMHHHELVPFVPFWLELTNCFQLKPNFHQLFLALVAPQFDCGATYSDYR